MPYTSLLGLSLPTTGSLSGTWGDEVNNAITSLLDSAVAGTTTLSADADVTLTTTDGAANQARSAIILWTAGGTVTRNITAPARSKAYVVINATSNTQSIVIRGTGPTTGVTVAAGRKVIVAWNGSDFIEVTGGVVNLATDVTGVLSATNGGTGVTTGLTVLNASNITSGIVSAANGGTGLTTGLTVLNASNLTSGTVGTARLASGTADSSTFLRGDQTWASIPGTLSSRVIMQNNIGYTPISSGEVITNTSSTAPTANQNILAKTDSYYVSFPTAATPSSNLYTSTDGVTWTLRTVPFVVNSTVRYTVSGDVIIIYSGIAGGSTFSESNGYRAVISTNGGVTWTAMTVPTQVTSLAASEYFYANYTYVAGTIKLFLNAHAITSTSTATLITIPVEYTSTDNGATWSAITNAYSQNSTGLQTYSPIVRYNNTIFINTGYTFLGANGTLKYSTDNGVTWTTIVGGNNAYRNFGITNGTSAMFGGTNNNSQGQFDYCLNIATPGTWTFNSSSMVSDGPIGSGIYALGNYIVSTQTSGIKYSSNLTTWTAPTTATGTGLNAGPIGTDAFAFNGTTVIKPYTTGTNTTVTIAGSTALATWTNIGSFTSGISTAAFNSAVSIGTTFMVTISRSTTDSNEIWTSPDGITWTQKTSIALGSNEYIAALRYIGTTVYAFSNRMNTYSSTNSGTTWSTFAANTGLTATNINTYGFRLAAHSNNTDLAYVDAEGGLCLSADAGANWSKKLTSYAANANTNFIYPTSTGAKLVLGNISSTNSRYIFYWYSSNGTTWTSGKMPTALGTTIPAGINVKNAEYTGLWFYNSGSIYTTNTSGSTWTLTDTTTANNYPIKYTTGCYVYTNGYLMYVGTTLNGPWSAKSNSYLPTSGSVTLSGDGKLPIAAISSTYMPTPFNTSVTGVYF